MNNSNIAYLINSTPAYYYILELHLVLLRRYAPKLKWQVFLATEQPEHHICKLLVEKYDVKLLVLEKENASFLNSRKRSLELLPENISMVLPIQEDFLLERFIDEKSIEESIEILENYESIFCIRYMPCPGPSEKNPPFSNTYNYFNSKNDFYMFSFQASLWKRQECLKWYYTTNSKKIEVDMNIAENSDGQKLYKEIFSNKFTLGYKRAHKNPNAVYMSPWPYRPTAIIKGVLQPFAKELATREGVIDNSQD